MMEDVLRRLQSPDNAVRGEAEAQFVAAKATPSVCLEVLAVLATASADELVREAAAVLLRRTAKELWGGADERVRLGVKNTLLQSIRGDYRDGLRKKVRWGGAWGEGAWVGGCGCGVGVWVPGRGRGTAMRWGALVGKWTWRWGCGVACCALAAAVTAAVMTAVLVRPWEGGMVGRALRSLVAMVTGQGSLLL